MTKLSLEMEIFNKNVDRWCKDGLTGQVVLIYRDRVVGFFNGPGDAWQEGDKAFGHGNFFMATILPQDSVNTTCLGACGVVKLRAQNEKMRAVLTKLCNPNLCDIKSADLAHEALDAMGAP